MNKTVSAAVLALALAGGIQLFPAAISPRLLVAGPSNFQPKAVAWGVTVCPPGGAVVEELAFIAQVTSADGGLPYATFIAEDHATGEALCSLQIPCDVAVRSTTATSDCSTTRCTPGDPIHIEWAPDLPDGGSLSGCAGDVFPEGAGSATLRMGP